MENILRSWFHSILDDNIHVKPGTKTKNKSETRRGRFCVILKDNAVDMNSFFRLKGFDVLKSARAPKRSTVSILFIKMSSKPTEVKQRSFEDW